MVERLNDIKQRARKVMPGGVSSPVRALNSVDGDPLFIEKSYETTLVDVEGQQYIDYCMSFGPLILGHSDQRVIKAVEKQIKNGLTYGTSSRIEVELAEKIIELHPSTDWIRFVNSGTEAVMSAIRLARGYTNRRYIVKFEGTYHGHADSMLVKAGSGLATIGLSSSAGVPSSVSSETLVLPLGDSDKLKALFEKFGEDIAAVIIEGVPANNGLLVQSSTFMHEIQSHCKEYGSMFILDEVITGFRIGLAGATGYYNLYPDIVTFGKIIGGGFPVGAYGGRADLMSYIAPLGPVYQAGTLSGNPVAMSAGLTTLEILSDQNGNVYRELDKKSEDYAKALDSIFADNSIQAGVVSLASILWIVFQENRTIFKPEQLGIDAQDKYKVFHKKLLKQGVYLPPSPFEVSFLSTAHSSKILNWTLDKISEVVTNL